MPDVEEYVFVSGGTGYVGSQVVQRAVFVYGASYFGSSEIKGVRFIYQSGNVSDAYRCAIS